MSYFKQEAGTNYCIRADIFSLGIIFFELFHIFDTQMERLKVCFCRVFFNRRYMHARGLKA